MRTPLSKPEPNARLVWFIACVCVCVCVCVFSSSGAYRPLRPKPIVSYGGPARVHAMGPAWCCPWRSTLHTHERP